MQLKNESGASLPDHDIHQDDKRSSSQGVHRLNSRPAYKCKNIGGVININ